MEHYFKKLDSFCEKKTKFCSLAHVFGKSTNSEVWLKIVQAAKNCAP